MISRTMRGLCERIEGASAISVGQVQRGPVGAGYQPRDPTWPDQTQRHLRFVSIVFAAGPAYRQAGSIGCDPILINRIQEYKHVAAKWNHSNSAPFAGEWFKTAWPEHGYILDILPPPRRSGRSRRHLGIGVRAISNRLKSPFARQLLCQLVSPSRSFFPTRASF
jgi:hypothetical protein